MIALLDISTPELFDHHVTIAQRDARHTARLLRAMGACHTRHEYRGKTLEEAWRTAKHPFHLDWLLRTMWERSREPAAGLHRENHLIVRATIVAAGAACPQTCSTTYRRARQCRAIRKVFSLRGGRTF